MKRLLLIAIRLYQLCLSPFVGGQCRFYPSCSAYASEAIDTHGALTGSWLALRRLLRDPESVRSWPDRRMPAFTTDMLPDTDLDAILAWLTYKARASR